MKASVSRSQNLKTKMWKGFVALIVLALFFSLVKSTIYPFLNLFFSFFLNLAMPSITNQKIFAVPITLLLVPAVLLLMVYLLGTFSNYLRLKRPLLQLLSKKIPLVDIVRQVQENPKSFVEAMFEWPSGSGVFKKGILIAEKGYQLQGKTVVLCSIWEPKPISLGGEIYYIREDIVIRTGRNAAQTIKEISLGYGRTS